MRPARAAAFTILALAALFLLLAAGTWALSRTDWAAARAAASASAALGQPVRLAGLAVGLLPAPSVRLEGLEVGRADGAGPLLSLAHARAGLRWPQLAEAPRMLESLALEGLTLRLRVAADGGDNWTALVDRVVELAGEGPSAFAVGALTIEGGRVEYADARAAGGLVLSSVVLEAHGVEPARPFPLKLRIAGEAGEHVFHAAGETEATLDPDRSRYAFEVATLRGWIGGGDFGTGGADLAGAAQRVAVDFGAGTASLEGLAFEALGLRGRARLAVASLGAAPVVGFSVDTDPFAPRAVANALGRPLPATSDPAALGQAVATLEGRFDAGGLTLERIAGRLDDTAFSGSLRRPPAPAVPRIELTLDAIDLDRYLPPGSSAPPLPAVAVATLFGAIDTVELDAVVQVGEASLADTVARQLRVTIEPSAAEPARP